MARHKVYSRILKKTLERKGGTVDKALRAAADKIERESQNIWARSVIDPANETGTYRSSFYTERRKVRGVSGWYVGNRDRKANWLEYGTGIYGPFRTPIEATQASHLLFFWASQGRWVKAAQVRGRPATPTLTAAAELCATENGWEWKANESAAIEGRSGLS